MDSRSSYTHCPALTDRMPLPSAGGGERAAARPAVSVREPSHTYRGGSCDRSSFLLTPVLSHDGAEPIAGDRRRSRHRKTRLPCSTSGTSAISCSTVPGRGGIRDLPVGARRVVPAHLAVERIHGPDVPGDANLRTPVAWRSEDGLERNHRPFGIKGFSERGDRMLRARRWFRRTR
jgi:hypothetical protein